MQTKKMPPDAVHKIFEILSSLNPEPKSELNYTNFYTLLVAVVLSAQATDIGVNKATKDLFKTVKTPEDMIGLGEEGLKHYIKTIGLYNSKAKNLIKLSQQLIDYHDSQVPHTREELESLAGVGRKTANVVLNVAFGQNTMAVDTHIFRLGNRLGLAPGKTPLEVEKGLEENIPPEYLRHAHHWLILHGRYICKARKPLCYKCPIVEYCPYEPKKYDALKASLC